MNFETRLLISILLVVSVIILISKELGSHIPSFLVYFFIGIGVGLVWGIAGGKE